MPYVPYQGGTFLVPSGPQGSHLYVVMTRACENNFHLLLSVSTIRPNKYYDPACVFAGGEHEFIKHSSFVDYAKPEQRGVQHIVTCVKTGSYVPKADLEGVYIDKILDGAETSERIKPWARDYLFENC